MELKPSFTSEQGMTTQNEVHVRLIEMNSVFGLEVLENIFEGLRLICPDLHSLAIDQHYPLAYRNSERSGSAPYTIYINARDEYSSNVTLTTYRLIENRRVTGAVWNLISFPDLRLAEVIGFKDHFHLNGISITTHPYYQKNYHEGLPEPTVLFQELKHTLNCNVAEELKSMRHLGVAL